MTKVDALKALREARYAAQQAQVAAMVRTAPPAAVPAAAVPAKAAVPKVTPRKAATPKVAAAADASAPSTLCGHRSIGNKACQRETGHAEKSHRYK